MVHLKLFGRYLSLIFLSTGTGMLASLLNPLVAIRGALLGATLGIGIVAINLECARQYNRALPPTLWAIAIISLCIGFIGGLGVNLFTVTPPKLGVEEISFYVPHTASGWPTVALVCVYSLLLQFVYASRWRREKASRRRIVLYTLLASLAITLMRAVIEILAGRQSGIELTNTLMHEPLGAMYLWIVFTSVSALPFLIPWVLIVSRLDPAWSLERWHNLHLKSSD